MSPVRSTRNRHIIEHGLSLGNRPGTRGDRVVTSRGPYLTQVWGLETRGVSLYVMMCQDVKWRGQLLGRGNPTWDGYTPTGSRMVNVLGTVTCTALIPQCGSYYSMNIFLSGILHIYWRY